MSWLGKKISELQSKPYQTRLRILWTAAAISAVIILLLWFATLHLRNLAPANDSVSRFGKILKNFKLLKPRS